MKEFPNPGLYAGPRFSPDGQWLATTMGNDLRLWTVGEWREGPRFEGDALAFTPDGRLLAIAPPAGSVRLVEAETGRLVASLDDPQQSRAGHATFTADGSRLILTGEQSHAAHVWDLRTIRRGLAAMDLDWDWPSPAGGDVTMPAAGIAPRRDGRYGRRPDSSVDSDGAWEGGGQWHTRAAPFVSKVVPVLLSRTSGPHCRTSAGTLKMCSANDFRAGWMTGFEPAISRSTIWRLNR